MTNPDLLSLVLTLRPTETAECPAYLGPAAHAVTLEAIARSNAALAQRLHDESGAKPFTVSPLIGANGATQLSCDETYRLRFTAQTAAVAEALLAQTNDGGLLALGSLLTLDKAVLKVESANDGGHWAGQTTGQALAARWLLGRGRPPDRLAFHFTSPTTFRSGGKNVPVPMPDWVFGSLLDKWNAFGPVTLPPEVRQFAAERVAISRYELATRGLPLKSGLRIGAVGRVTYAALDDDRYFLCLLNLLADFALYAGVGAGTTMGLGQCRRIADF